LINTFPYSDEYLQALELSISQDRLAPYFQKTRGNRKKAIQFYVWNMMISSTFYPPLQCLEVTLRNSIHRELSKKYNATWYENINNLLKYNDQEKIQSAKDALLKQGKPLEPSRIVAELSFGFWVSLLGKGERGNYETLWRNALYKAFPNAKPRRKEVHNDLDKIRKLRNRIAHHEPIHKRDLREDYDLIIQLIEFMCTNTAEWTKHHNYFQEIYQNKPIKIINPPRKKKK